jgi:NitT/TauT family transport system substrate-binding protein
VAAGERPFVVGSGDQVILARAQGLPVVYVLNWYRRFPIAVFSLEPLDGPDDLRGKRVGIPGLFGASYIGWQALLYASGMDPSAVRLETIGFTQVETLLEGRVDAAVGYAMNEPVQLRQMGRDVGVIDVSDHIDLVANGNITNEQTIAERPELVEGVVRAVLRGLRYTLDNPSDAFEMTLKYVPEAGGENREAQMAVLEASLKYWGSDRLGFSNAAAWETSQRFMRDVGLIQQVTDVNQMFTNRFVEGALSGRDS